MQSSCDRQATDVSAPGNQRTLEEMDLLFAADTPWNWDAERNYNKLAEENPQILQVKRWSQIATDNESRLRPLSLVKLDITPSLHSLSTLEALWKWRPRSRVPSVRNSTRRRTPSEVSFTTFIDTEKSRRPSTASEDGMRETKHVEETPPIPPIPTTFLPLLPGPSADPEKLRLMRTLQARKREQALVKRASMVSQASELDTPFSEQTAATKGESGTERSHSFAETHLGDLPSTTPEKMRLMKALQLRKRQQGQDGPPNIGILTFEKAARGRGESSRATTSRSAETSTGDRNTIEDGTGTWQEEESNVTEDGDDTTQKR